MKAKRNARGRYHNPQPLLFIGIRDDPSQGLLFQGTEADAGGSQEQPWTNLFDQAQTRQQFEEAIRT